MARYVDYDSKRAFFDIEGGHKCRYSEPSSSRRVWFQRTHTGSGTIYLFNDKPRERVMSSYADHAFGWIAEGLGSMIRLPADQGWCNFWREAEVASNGYDDADIVEDVIEFTNNVGLDKSATVSAMNLMAESTNYTWQHAPWNSSETPQAKQAAPQGTKMNKTQIAVAATSLVERNKDAAKAAGFAEAGRIANKELTKIIAPRLPMMARGYLDTPLGRLVLANVAVAAAQQFKPDHKPLQALVQAMATQAYVEIVQTVKIDEFIENLLENKTISAALTSVDPKD